MKALFFILLISLVLGVTNPAMGTLIIGSPSALPVNEDIKVEQIDIQANASGYFSELTTTPIKGELLEVAWDKGNFTGIGTVTLKSYLPAAASIDSFNISAANAFRSPGLKLQGSTDIYGYFHLFSKVWVNMTGAQHNGSATLYIIWR